ncbi:hypothetical protein OMW55_12455 [Sphingomonas sp. BN140010]|uniref:PhiE125 gp8 family phage protein n=1 Tax=Sphingomonas arvum TaxID=2992113 RepID=A0ABT3JHR0_9SPHN|nr:hypothetical protein [Sphingomonas sp. BN140010]MCW3798618.1 hypothetical protein [Sphingomonas sp. BN140010]
MNLVLASPIVSLNEAQSFVRVETGEEEALLAGLVRTASAICETFLNQVVVCRAFQEKVLGSGSWQALHASPVRSIDNVAAGAGTPNEVLLTPDEYQIDIDDRGAGWVRLPHGVRLVVRGTAGLAMERNAVPEPIRQGVLRLVSHLYTVRDSKDDQPPASVTALWRPYRRMVIA